jgi:YhcH/YjgK/YiaL family protein
MTNCKSGHKNIEEWSDRQINEWITSSGWDSGLPFKPDAGMNKRMFVLQNQANANAWKAAFDFLQRNDLNELALGRYELSDDGTYAAISEYQTKDYASAKYEAHRKYIDIQYVAKGEEYIETLPLKQINEEQQYNPQADIMFFEDKTEGQMLLADQTRFFVFFPEDAHKPCLKVDSVATVKKIVVKIPFSE